MLKTYWHISGPGFDVDEFIARHGLRAEKHWYQGRKNDEGVVSEESGCSILISSEMDTETHFDEVNEYLESRYLVLEELAERGIRSTVDTAFSASSPGTSRESVRLSPEVLTKLANAGVELEVSIHPASNGHGKKAKE